MSEFLLYLPNMDENIFIVFGIFLLCGVLAGVVANRFRWMPSITAFMILGLLIGPHVLGLINKEVLFGSRVLVEIALGLILYKLGNMLHLQAMIRSRKLGIMALAECTATFLCVFALMTFLKFDWAMSGIVAAIAVSSSPAVLVHVANEMGASGPVIDRAQALVAINNLVSFLIFSMILPFMAFQGGETSLAAISLTTLGKVLAAVLVGICVGYIATRIVRWIEKRDEHYRFAIVIGGIMLTLGVCQMFDLSPLLASLVLGMAVRRLETSKHNLSKVGLGEGGDLFFIVLFVMAGAKINPVDLWMAGLVPILLVAVRSVAKMASVFVVAPYSGLTRQQCLAAGGMMIPMAGMAIGLVTTTMDTIPELGSQIAVIVLAMVAIFETLGPFIVQKSILAVGEAESEQQDSPESEENQKAAANA
jgi:Kef-type K+ transport system membrane component KefB